jgi:hypothetical protein
MLNQKLGQLLLLLFTQVGEILRTCLTTVLLTCIIHIISLRHLIFIHVSRDSADAIATGCRLVGRVSIPGRGTKDISVCYSVQTKPPIKWYRRPLPRG